MFKKYLIILFSLLSFICLFFGESFSHNSLYFPIKQKNYIISSKFGYRTLGNYHFHNGIDIPAVEGTPLYSLSSGVVSYAGFNNSYGHCIIIKYTNGYKSLYGHCSSNYIVKAGQSVSPNELVGFVGPKYLSDGELNGYTTGMHLHFTLYLNNKLINPLDLTYIQN